jgi:hypothetical protein
MEGRMTDAGSVKRFYFAQKTKKRPLGFMDDVDNLIKPADFYWHTQTSLMPCNVLMLFWCASKRFKVTGYKNSKRHLYRDVNSTNCLLARTTRKLPGS